MNENDVVLFEDYNMKVLHCSASETSTEISETQGELEYDNLNYILYSLIDHFVYVEFGFFDKLKFLDVQEYFEQLDEFEYHDDPIDILVVLRKPLNFQNWVSYNLEKLKESYAYIERISRNRGMVNNSFYRFTLLGYKTSTSSSSSYLIP